MWNPFNSPKDVEKSLKGLLNRSIDRVAVYSKKVRAEKDYENLDIEDIEKKIRNFLVSFLGKYLPVISE